MQLLNYKKVIGFTETQKKAFQTLEDYGINVNQFIRLAVKEKLAKDWKSIKESKEKIKCPFSYFFIFSISIFIYYLLIKQTT